MDEDKQAIVNEWKKLKHYHVQQAKKASQKIAELEGHTDPRDLPPVECFDCSDGRLIVRTGKHGDFYGCTNYPGCMYTAYICPECGFPMLGWDKCSECSYRKTSERRR